MSLSQFFRLKKNALVEVDSKKRITKYEANDRSLRLERDQSRYETLKTTNFESKRSLRSSVNSWSVPKNEEVKEMENLMKFIKEKCENVETPLNKAKDVSDVAAKRNKKLTEQLDTDSKDTE